MSDRPDDGGPAFPATPTWPNGETDYFPGMSLRAYIATAVLQGIIAGNYIDGYAYEEQSRDAIKFADALIAELRKDKP